MDAIFSSPRTLFKPGKRLSLSQSPTAKFLMLEKPDGLACNQPVGLPQEQLGLSPVELEQVPFDE